MAKIEIKDASGKTVKEADLNAAVFGIEPNVPVMHQVVRSQQAALRQGTHSTKTRGQVSGGGRKPWRQKGTGRARQGTIRAPHWVGGGTVFGPHPRSYAFRVNRKEVKLAERSALSAKLADSDRCLARSSAEGHAPLRERTGCRCRKRPGVGLGGCHERPRRIDGWKGSVSSARTTLGDAK